MKKVKFPLCCTAKVICDFGGTKISEGNKGPTDEEELREEIEKQLGWKNTRGTLLVAITNSGQKAANKVLKEFGFSCTKWMSKAQHDTKIKLWWKQTGLL